MGIFDGFNNLSQGDLAALSFFGNMATAPSRIPVPLAYSFAHAAGGIPQSMQEGQNLQKTKLENQMNQLNLGYTQQMMPYRIGALRDAYNDAGGNMPMGIPNSVSNNNPGNMRPIGASTGFQSFATPEDGANAMAKDLNLKISGLSPAMKGQSPTLSNVISTWAPATENDTPSYIKFVSDETGIKPDQVLTSQHIPALQAAMTKFEGNSANKSSPTSVKLPPEVQAQVTQLRRDKVLSPPEKWGEIDAKIAELYQNSPEAKAKVEEATKTAANKTDAMKSVAAVKSTIDNSIKDLEHMKELSKRMPDRGPADLEVWGSRHLGSQNMESAWNEFNTLNKQMFVNGLMGAVPPGSRLDIPIVNALKGAKEVDPYTSETAREAVIDSHIRMLKKAQQNAEKNYGIISGSPVTEEKVTPSGNVTKWVMKNGQLEKAE